MYFNIKNNSAESYDDDRNKKLKRNETSQKCTINIYFFNFKYAVL